MPTQIRIYCTAEVKFELFAMSADKTVPKPEISLVRGRLFDHQANEDVWLTDISNIAIADVEIETDEEEDNEEG